MEMISKIILMFVVVVVVSSCASNYEYKPYTEHGFTCAEVGTKESDLKCIEVDGNFDGTDFHKEYEVDYNSWKDLR